MPRLSSFTLTLALCFSLATLAACDRQTGGKAQPKPESTVPGDQAGRSTASPPNAAVDRSFKGSRMPDMVLADASGHRLQLAKLTGKPVLLNLWATWCAPCILEMPSLDTLAQQRGGALRVVTVSQDMQGGQAVTPFFAKAAFRKLEPWLDPDNNLGFHFGGATLPFTVLYDAQGREVWRTTGGHDWTSPASAALIAEVSGR